ncbi:RHS repeat domain-containing protein [Lachnospiraceae bacterium 64-25]
MEDGSFMQETLSYDAMGRITASLREGSSPAFARSVEYAYDSVGHLLPCKEGNTIENYGYDMLGNRILKQLDGINKATYQYNALNQLVSRTEDGVQYSYGYDRRGNLIKEHRGDVQTHQYIYDATNHMTLGKNLENGTQTEYAYNALYMRIRNIQTIAGEDGFHTREVSYLPDFLSRTDNELMAYEKGKYSLRAVFGRGYERLAGIAAMETEAAGAGVSPLEAQMPRAAGVELSGAEAVTVTPVERLYFQSDFYGSPLFASNGQGQVLRYAERSIWGDLKQPAVYQLWF